MKEKRLNQEMEIQKLRNAKKQNIINRMLNVDDKNWLA